MGGVSRRRRCKSVEPTAADPPTQPVVVFDNVSLAFDDKVVLKDVSFTLLPGHTKIILGASGSGKSTILKLILGLLKPDAGAIWVNGERVDTMSERELMTVRADLGMVFQEGALFDSLTVAENVGYKLYEETDMPLDQVDARVEEVLGFVGLARVHRPDAVGAVGRAAPPRRDRARDGGQAAASCSTTRRRPVSIRSRQRRSTRRSSSCATSKASARSSSRTSCATRSSSPRTRPCADGIEIVPADAAEVATRPSSSC